MLDRYLLRYFLAVVDHGNFSRAASQCNVSQPTLSVGVAKLEREVGAPLFVRSNQRVELTEAGARFLPHARRIGLMTYSLYLLHFRIGLTFMFWWMTDANRRTASHTRLTQMRIAGGSMPLL